MAGRFLLMFIVWPGSNYFCLLLMNKSLYLGGQELSEALLMPLVASHTKNLCLMRHIFLVQPLYHSLRVLLGHYCVDTPLMQIE